MFWNMHIKPLHDTPFELMLPFEISTPHKNMDLHYLRFNYKRIILRYCPVYVVYNDVTCQMPLGVSKYVEIFW